jgi:hypothetical protein
MNTAILSQLAASAALVSAALVIGFTVLIERRLVRARARG